MNRLDEALGRLTRAVEQNRSTAWCHRLWSKFIRLRDGRCFGCNSTTNLTAHHILRKCVIPSVRFETGNGITLCRRCHESAHATFNGRPLEFEPLNARGGDDVDLMADAYEFLIEDGRQKGILNDAYYFVSDTVLEWFCAANGFSKMPTAGTRIEHAVQLIRMPGIQWYRQMGMAALACLLEEDVEKSFDVFDRVVNARVLH